MQLKHRFTVLFFFILTFSSVVAAQLTGSPVLENIIIAVLVMGGVILIIYFLLQRGGTGELETAQEVERETGDTVESMKNLLNRGRNALANVKDASKEKINNTWERGKNWKQKRDEYKEQRSKVESDLNDAMDEISRGMLNDKELDKITDAFRDAEMKKRSYNPLGGGKGKIIYVRSALDSLKDDVERVEDGTGVTDQIVESLETCKQEIDDYLLARYEDFAAQAENRLEEVLHREDEEQLPSSETFDVIGQVGDRNEVVKPLMALVFGGDHDFFDKRAEEEIGQVQTIMADTCIPAFEDALSDAPDELREELEPVYNELETVYYDEIPSVIASKEKEKKTAVKQVLKKALNRFYERKNEVMDVIETNQDMLETVAEEEEAVTNRVLALALTLSKIEALEEEYLPRLEEGWEQLSEDTAKVQRALDADNMGRIMSNTADLGEAARQFQDTLEHIAEYDGPSLLALQDKIDTEREALQTVRTDIDAAYKTYSDTNALLRFGRKLFKSKNRELVESLQAEDSQDLEHMGAVLDRADQLLQEVDDRYRTVWDRWRRTWDRVSDVREQLHTVRAAVAEIDIQESDDTIQQALEDIQDCEELIAELEENPPL